MAAKLRPRVILPWRVSTSANRAAEARGRQLQRLVGPRALSPDDVGTHELVVPTLIVAVEQYPEEAQ